MGIDHTNLHPEMEALLDMYGPEDLHPELAFYVSESEELGWTMLHHPLVIMVPFTEEMNKMANMAFAQKIKALEHAMQRGDFNSWVFLHERPYRVTALVDLRSRVPLAQDEWGSLVADVWVDCENIWQNLHLWQEILSTTNPLTFMSPEERVFRRVLRQEGTPVELWRGWGPDGDPNGLSWSLSRKQAAWFATRFGGSIQNLRKIDLDPKLIWAYSNRRKEDECIVLALPGEMKV